MPLSRVRARQPGLWSLITNAEIIFMNPHWPQPDRNLYLNLHSYFHIICLYECISLVRKHKTVARTTRQPLPLFKFAF